MIPDIRIRQLNKVQVRADGDYVLYWMIAFRRTRYNFALEYAVQRANDLGKPLLVFEPLGVRYKWASARFHQFVADGMRDNHEKLSSESITYYPYLERKPHEADDLLPALAKHACCVITDDFPAFHYPEMLQSASRKLDVSLTAVDSNGVLPLRAAEKVFLTAHSFRRFLQKQLREHLIAQPLSEPLNKYRIKTHAKIPKEMLQRWPTLRDTELKNPAHLIESLPIDHNVNAVADCPGGQDAALRQLKSFVRNHISQYVDLRNHPDNDVASHLSPYLHFGHISSHEILAAITSAEKWSPGKISASTTGSRAGWWGMSAGVEAFLDQLITWREVGFNMCAHSDDYETYKSLPQWSQDTLAKHANDPREYVYLLDQFENADTHDEIWNSAQNQLVREGYIHNYLRMLWGKKIIEWTKAPQDALEIMIHLNNKYALDGRDPNSYSGIFWCLGRYDRPWGPERKIFGTVRFMSSANIRKKVRLKSYLKRYDGSESDSNPTLLL